MLIEIGSGANANVQGTLTNYGTIHKTQLVPEVEIHYFGLTAPPRLHETAAWFVAQRSVLAHSYQSMGSGVAIGGKTVVLDVKTVADVAKTVAKTVGNDSDTVSDFGYSEAMSLSVCAQSSH
jgi:hypothetical protein